MSRPGLLVFAVAAALLAGCAERLPLSEVPITGGTAPQRAAVRRALQAFEDAVGPERVALTEVVLGEVHGLAMGRYHPGRDRIRVEPTLDGPLLERVVRHELCHALDFTEGLMEAPHPLFDDRIRGLFRIGAVDTDDLGGPRHRRGEAFARYCDLGPLPARALRTPCPNEPRWASQVARTLERDVWRATHHPPLPDLGPPHASWAAPHADPEEFGVVGLTDPGGIRVRYDHRLVDVDIDTGDARGPGAAAILPPAELPDGIDDLCPLYAWFGAGAGSAAGTGAVLATFDLHTATATRRVLATDGGRWGVVRGCVPQEHTDVFTTADGGVWLAWVDDVTVVWAPLVPPPAP